MKPHDVIRDSDLLTTGVVEQCPRLVETLALRQRAQRQHGVSSGVAPSRSGALQPLSDQRLAGGLDDTGVDG